MAGLGTQIPGLAPAPTSGAPMPGVPPGMPMPPEDAGDGNVSPEEQAQYTQWVENGLQIVHNKEMVAGLLETIAGDGDPIHGLATAVAMLAIRLDESAREAGTEISGDAKYHGSVELMEAMVELAEEAKIHEYSEEDMERALLLALDMYREIQQQRGVIKPEDFAADFQQLLEADQQGQLDQIVPGASQYAARAAGGKPGAAPMEQGAAAPAAGRRG